MKDDVLVLVRDENDELPGEGQAFDWSLTPSVFGPPDQIQGLLWGMGDDRLFARGPRDEGKWVVAEVNLVDLEKRKDIVAFRRGRVALAGSFVDAATYINERLPKTHQDEWDSLSQWPHKSYIVDLESRADQVWNDEDYNADAKRNRVEIPFGPLANCYSSEVVGTVDRFEFDGPIPFDSDPFDLPVVRMTKRENMHTVAIDVDHPVRLIESTTLGHYHLLIDVPMPWWKYRRLLKALKVAGIIEPGYYSAAVGRRATFLRMPWVKKPL